MPGNELEAGDASASTGSDKLEDLREKYAGEKDVISASMEYVMAAHGKTLGEISAAKCPLGSGTHLDELIEALGYASNRGVAIGIGKWALDGGIKLYGGMIELKLKNPEAKDEKIMTFTCPYANKYNGSRI